jgi:hypothetical protein
LFPTRRSPPRLRAGGSSGHRYQRKDLVRYRTREQGRRGGYERLTQGVKTSSRSDVDRSGFGPPLTT